MDSDEALHRRQGDLSAAEAITDTQIRFASPDDQALKLLRPLGRGAMSDVYLAREPALGRLVAVKFLRHELAESAVARARFEREGRAAAAVLHPNVATVLRVGHLESGLPFLVLPYIKGPNYAQRLLADGPRPRDEVIAVLRTIAGALEAAHEHGIVHRDVRPDNVILEEDTGRVFLTDFGLAAVLESGDEVVERLTKSGEIALPPGYASLEQRVGGPITDRTDVHGLGVLALALLNGEPPRDGSSSALSDSLGRAASRDPALVALVSKWVAEKPELRPSIRDVLRHLDELAAGDRWIIRRFSPKVRRIAEVLAGVGGGGWLALEIIDQLQDHDVISPLVYAVALPTVVAFLASALVLAWFHGAAGRQAVRVVEVALLALIGLTWLAAVTVTLTPGLLL